MNRSGSRRWPRSWAATLPIVLALGSPCRASSPPAQDFLERPLIAWGTLTYDLVSDAGQDPVLASRTFLLVSSAQDRAIHESGATAPTVSEAYLAALVAGASARTLEECFKGFFDGHQILSELTRRALAEGMAASELETAIAQGERGAREVLRTAPPVGVSKAAAPRFDGDQTLTTRWRTLDNRPPIQPDWGSLEPLAVEGLDNLLPPAPPPVDGEAVVEALREVRRLTTELTPEDRTVILRWADAVGTAGPAGHWNSIAWQLLEQHKIEPAAAVQILVDLNTALFDAGIACWRAKYRYMYPRPSQLDPTITPALHVPNFPSYVSGHSTFSAAAATVLGWYFPDDARRLRHDAEEASRSRVLAGLHFRFDCDEGMRLGRRIGEAVLTSRRPEINRRELLQIREVKSPLDSLDPAPQ